jgi:hypothetical protein
LIPAKAFYGIIVASQALVLFIFMASEYRRSLFNNNPKQFRTIANTFH